MGAKQWSRNITFMEPVILNVKLIIEPTSHSANIGYRIPYQLLGRPVSPQQKIKIKEINALTIKISTSKFV